MFVYTGATGWNPYEVFHVKSTCNSDNSYTSYAPVKVNLGEGGGWARHITAVRLTLHRTISIRSDIILTLQMVENINLLRGDSNSESRVGILTEKHFSNRIPLGQPGGGGAHSLH